MELDVSALKIEEIRDINKIRAGYYEILLANGTKVEGEVDKANINSVHIKLRRYRESLKEKLDAAIQSEQSSASLQFDNPSPDNTDEPDFSKLNLTGSILDIELNDPNFQPFWCREDEVHYRLNMMGYVHAKLEDVRNINCIASSSKIGDSISSDGVVRINELILLKVHKKIVEKINEYHKSKEFTPEGVQQDYVKRGGMVIDHPSVSRRR